MPAIDPKDVPVRNSCGYPEPYLSQVMPREKRALGDACGLTKIGVNLTTLAPGKASSVRHWHAHEDELIYLLEGELVMITNEGERVLTAGMCAGFPAGEANPHTIENRAAIPARYLEVSNRVGGDDVEYVEGVDLVVRAGKMSRRDGSPL